MVAYITMRNFGIHPMAAKSSISTIINMKHFVRTTYGDSAQYYGGEKWLTKPHGCGQGNGYGPALWACISSPMLMLMKEKGYGTKLQRPISGQKLTISAFSFVDDTDIIETNERNDEHQLLDQAQSSIDTWEALLRTTGGALEPDKSFWISLQHGQKDGRNSLTPRTTTRMLTMRNDNGERISIQEKRPTDASCYLGVWQSPTGDDTDQVNTMIGHITQWSTSITANRMGRTEARLASKLTIGRKLVYPLPATAMNENQCKRIQKNLNTHILGKIGIVRTAPRILTTAPISLRGFGLLDISLAQMLAHIDILSIHGHQSTLTAKLIYITSEYHALETGWAGDPWQIPAQSYTTENTWVTTTIASFRKYDVSIHTNLAGLSKWINDDSMIMEVCDRLPGNIKQKINNVRIYLKVCTLSDLLTADGRFVDEHILLGHQSYNSPSPSQRRYKWMQSNKPRRPEITIWTQTLCQIFNITTADRRQSRIQNVRWHKKAYNYSNWLYHSKNDCLLQNVGTYWKVWTKQDTGQRTRRQHRIFSNTGDIIHCLPHDGIQLATVVQTTDNTILVSTSNGSVDPTQDTPATHWLTSSTQFVGTNTSNILQVMAQGRCKVVSDGSFKDGSTTYAFVIGHTYTNKTLHEIDFTQLIHGSGKVPGLNTEQNSYRGELAGILAAIIFMHNISIEYNLTGIKCTVLCDNKGALMAAFGYKRPRPRWASYDLVATIRGYLKRSHIHWIPQHIKAHQDKKIDFEFLPEEAQANVIADYLSGQAHNTNMPQIHTPIDGQPWVIRCKNRYIGGNIHQQITRLVYEPTVQTFWMRKFGITTMDKDLYNWDVFFGLHRQMSSGRQIWTTKFMAGLLPTMKNLKRRGHSDEAQCPICGGLEDNFHLLQCPGDMIKDIYDDHYLRIEAYLKNTTNPELRTSILHLISSLRHGNTHHNNDTCDLTAPYQQEFGVGMRSFLAGLWPRTWTDQQQQYIKANTGRDKGGNMWLTRLVILLQELIYEIWRFRNDTLHNKEENCVSQGSK